jgi:ankyrin repeat protein
MSAAASHELENVKILFEKTKNINTQNKEGESALTFAVKNGSAEIVDFLLKNKADLKVMDNKGNNLGAYLVLSYRPTRPEQKDDFSEKITLLQSAGLHLTIPQNDGSSLLTLAASKNEMDLLKKLEVLNININAVDKEKMSALHKAALVAKDDSILKYLVGLGINKNLKTEFDETAFDLASENEILKKNKIDLSFLK